jgi:hypothetical protein
MSRRTFLKLKKGKNLKGNRRKKFDPVVRYQTLAAGWKKSKFLSSQPFGAKEGRKLQLATAFKYSSARNIIKPKKNTVSKKTFDDPTKRRDDITFKLRVLC